MPAAPALVDILVVLLAAKVAAELAERIGLPSVVGEILAGVAIGPSALGLVEANEIITVLAEIGVILLLLDVGLEMDLGELGAVGRAALWVALVGIVVPFLGGLGVGFAFGFDTIEAVFVGATLTATSVGISARVFGDLRALATVEARTVLGAAVADDVLGLVVLTVVVRLATSGTISVTEVGGVVLLAAGFLAVALVAGVRLVPPLFAAVARRSRSAGTLVAVALAFALAVAHLASVARLAPIVGAFVAGVALARSPVAERVRRELVPVGHLLVPVFFLQIGIDVDVAQFARPAVLGIAAALLVVAVLGKIVAAVGMGRAPGDRLLVGIGMIPRGEVGLIFATIGLREDVFGADVYAAVLLVVLLTTIASPQALRWRLQRLRAEPKAAAAHAASEPPGGWLAAGPQEVELRAHPPPSGALAVALRAALLAERVHPGPGLLAWVANLPAEPGALPWTRDARTAFFSVLAEGGPRSWRFLVATGVLARTLPELDEAVHRRAADPSELDPLGLLRWPRLARLRDSDDGAVPVENLEWVALAAVVLDAAEARGVDEPASLAGAVAHRLDLDPAATEAVTGLVADATLLPAAARRVDGFAEESVLQLAAHLGSVEHTRALQRLTATDPSVDGDDAGAVAALCDLVEQVLTKAESLHSPTSVEQRRAAALLLVDDDDARDALVHAPRAYLLTQAPLDLARQAALCSPTPGRDQVRVVVTPEPGTTSRWRVEIAAADRLGLLAHEARALGDVGLDVVAATVATWPDGCALAVFDALAFEAPAASRVEAALRADLSTPLATPPTVDVDLAFDDAASPWYTVCRVRAEDRFGLLAVVTAAFAAVGVSVHAARVATVDGEALDEFELTGPTGAKLGAELKASVESTLASGVTHRRGRLRARS